MHEAGTIDLWREVGQDLGELEPESQSRHKAISAAALLLVNGLQY